MLSCQLCGSCSWGPVAAGTVFRQSLPDGTEPRIEITSPGVYVRCDNCGSWGLKALIDGMGIKNPHPELGFLGGGSPFDSLMAPPLPGTQSAIGAMGGMFESIFPKKAPETRTERLVLGLLGANPREDGQRYSDYAVGIVACARQIEYQLDYGAVPVPLGSCEPEVSHDG